MSVLRRVQVLFAIVLLYPAISYGAEKRYDIPIEGSPSMGPENATVTIVEFLDYQ
jgi:hypothetical protein